MGMGCLEVSFLGRVVRIVPPGRDMILRGGLATTPLDVDGPILVSKESAPHGLQTERVFEIKRGVFEGAEGAQSW